MATFVFCSPDSLLPFPWRPSFFVRLTACCLFHGDLRFLFAWLLAAFSMATFVFCSPDSLVPFPWRLDKGCSLRGRTIQRGLRFPVPSNTKGDDCFLTTNLQRIADLGISLGVRDLRGPRGIYVHVPDHRYMWNRFVWKCMRLSATVLLGCCCCCCRRRRCRCFCWLWWWCCWCWPFYIALFSTVEHSLRSCCTDVILKEWQ